MCFVLTIKGLGEADKLGNNFAFENSLKPFMYLRIVHPIVRFDRNRQFGTAHLAQMFTKVIVVWINSRDFKGTMS